VTTDPEPVVTQPPGDSPKPTGRTSEPRVDPEKDKGDPNLPPQKDNGDPNLPPQKDEGEPGLKPQEE
jgi:hypothetical protein